MTLIRPWPWAILYGGKRVENRSWRPPANVRGQRIALHAGKKYDAESEKWILDVLKMPGPISVAARYEGIVGVATLRNVIGPYFAAGTLGADQLRWYMGGIAWVLGDVVALPEPVPCRGAQGLWTVPPDVERRVLAALPGATP